MRKIAAVLMAVLVSLVILAGCGGPKETSDEAYCLDTICTITIYDQSGSRAKSLIADCFEECERLENLLSKTVEGSEIDQINKAGGKPVEVSDETLEIIEKGLYYSKHSGGEFDITVGRLTDLWDFKAEAPVLPKEGDVKAAAKTVDYTAVKIDGNSVTLTDPDAKLDLGGIAKGYIADKVSAYLIEEGVTSAIVNLGGNVVAIGSKTDGSDWNIGIERPYSDRTEVIGSVGITDGTIVTSGIYERMFEIDGKIYHHILDVHTGYSSTSDIEAVSIRTSIGHSVDCDALSTICLLLGREKATALIESMDGYEASFIDRDDNITSTGGMNLVILDEEQ